MTSPLHGGDPEFESQRAHSFFSNSEDEYTFFSSCSTLASRSYFTSGCTTLISPLNSVLHQLDQKIICPHYDFKHLTEKYFEIGMKLDDFLIQSVKYCLREMDLEMFSHFPINRSLKHSDFKKLLPFHLLAFFPGM